MSDSITGVPRFIASKTAFGSPSCKEAEIKIGF